MVPIRGFFTVGRSQAATLRIPDPTLSRLHFCLFPGLSLRRRAPQWFLCDLGSLNGTWLNGVRVRRPAALRSLDIIQIGRSHFFAVIRATIRYTDATR